VHTKNRAMTRPAHFRGFLTKTTILARPIGALAGFFDNLGFCWEMSDNNVAFRRMTILKDRRLATMATGDRMLEEDNKNVAAKAWPTYLSAFWFEWR
jgi:hypothetical protein